MKQCSIYHYTLHKVKRIFSIAKEHFPEVLCIFSALAIYFVCIVPSLYKGDYLFWLIFIVITIPVLLVFLAILIYIAIIKPVIDMIKQDYREYVEECKKNLEKQND